MMFMGPGEVLGDPQREREGLAGSSQVDPKDFSQDWEILEECST